MTARRILALGAAAAALALPAPASAYWTATSVPGGAGQAAAGTVGSVAGLAAASPTADPDVRLSWSAATRADGAAVAGYRVRRYAGAAATDVCGSVAAPACTDAGVADGTYAYGVAARVGGAWSGTESARVTVVVDTAAPTITSAPAATTGATSAALAFSHARYARFSCRLDGGAATPCDAGTASYAGLGIGAHAFTVHALDAAGHATADATASWIVTGSAPTLAGPAATSAATTPALTFSAPGAASYACSLDGAAFAPCTSPRTVGPLADGAHAFAVRGLDGSGTPVTSDATRTWTVRTAAPAISARPASTSANAAPSVSFGDAVYASFRCSLDGGAAVACASPLALTSLHGGASLAAGAHAFSVQSLDADGVATAAATYAWTIDLSAPGISTSTPALSAATSAIFSLVDASYGTFACSLGGALAGCASPASYSGLADGAYTFRTHAVDADGYATADATFAWTVKHAAPTLSAQPAARTASQTASFSFAEAPYATFGCSLDGGAFAACNAGSATYAGLAGGTGTTHTFAVHAIDAAGNLTADQTATWVVDTAAPTAPTAVALANGGGTGGAYVNLANRSSVSVAVTLPSSSVATDTVSVTLSDGTHATVARTAPASAGAGTVTVTGIDASALTDGSVTLRATATDSVGNASSTTTATVTKDVVAPAAPVLAKLSFTDSNNATPDRVSGASGAVEGGATVQITQTLPVAGGPYTGTAAANGSFPNVDVEAVAGTVQNPVAVSFNVVAIDAAGNASAVTVLTGSDKK